MLNKRWLLAAALWAVCGSASSGPVNLDRADRADRSRLPFQDRRLGATLRPGGTGELPTRNALSPPAGCLAARPGRDADRAEFHRWPAALARRIHPSGHL